MSAPVGQAVGLIAGGLLLQWLATSSVLATGPLAGFEPWQAAFVIIGAPGLLLVPLFLLLHEPVRRGQGAAAPLSVAEVVAIVRERARALAPMFAGFCMVTLVSYTFFVWTPSVFQRTFDWNPAQAGLGFGLIVLVFGTGGAFFGGWMTDRLARRGHLDAPLKVAAFGFIGCGVFGGLAPLNAVTGARARDAGAGDLPLEHAVRVRGHVDPADRAEPRARAGHGALHHADHARGLGVGPTVVGLMTTTCSRTRRTSATRSRSSSRYGADHVHAARLRLAPLPRVARGA